MSRSITAKVARLRELVEPGASSKIVSCVDAALTLTQDLHAGRIVVMNRAAGVTLTLPAAQGTGDTYKILHGTELTGSGVIQVANAVDSFKGVVFMHDGDDDAVKGFSAADADDTITLNVTTTGGADSGDFIEIIDIAPGKFLISGLLQGSGAIATPFSAAVA